MKELLGYNIFRNHLSSFRWISEDRANREYMTMSGLPGINFDDVVDEYAKRHGVKKPHSNDALFASENDGLFYLIEFKNGIIDDTKIPGIIYKVYDSLLIYMDITGATVRELRENMIYILVYNEYKKHTARDVPDWVSKRRAIPESVPAVRNSASRTYIAAHVSEKAGMHVTRFGLKKFERLYVKEVHTFTKKEFDRYFIKKYETEYKNRPPEKSFRL